MSLKAPSFSNRAQEEIAEPGETAESQRVPVAPVGQLSVAAAGVSSTLLPKILR